MQLLPSVSLILKVKRCIAQCELEQPVPTMTNANVDDARAEKVMRDAIKITLPASASFVRSSAGRTRSPHQAAFGGSSSDPARRADL